MYVHTQEVELAQQKKTPPTNTPLGAEGGAELHGSPQQETFGGYDCKFVESFPSVFQTECPICRLILRNPYLTSCCGTHFCRTCSERLQAEYKPCPTCREDNFELYPNKSLRRSLNQLHVLCTHSKHGCEWTGELGKLEHHLSDISHSGESLNLKVNRCWLGSFCSQLCSVQRDELAQCHKHKCSPEEVGS